MKRFLVAIATTLLAQAKAQTFLEPFIGIAQNVRSRPFRQVVVGAQISQASSKGTVWLYRLQLDAPLTYRSSDSAFSANLALPAATAVAKKILPWTVAASVGLRVRVAGANTANQLAFIPALGLKYAAIQIGYRYDKNNYTILNPDQSTNRLGVFSSLAVEYMRVLNTGRFLTSLQLATPPVWQFNKRYPSSFSSVFPISLQVGYSIALKK